ncbi:hypothetical protein ABIB48_002331 [Arthrobacter sp. UYCu511]
MHNTKRKMSVGKGTMFVTSFGDMMERFSVANH